MAGQRRVFIDRGGTFTDVVVVDGQGRARARKVPSDRAVVGDIAASMGADRVTFGTTVATNALLERRVAQAALIVTAGFEDLPWIGDMRRPKLFEPNVGPPPPLVDRIVGLEGRMDSTGREVEPLQLTDEVVGQLRLLVGQVEAIAVVLLHANVNPAHELLVQAQLHALKPSLAVTLGHRCVPERGYVARIETAMVDAAVTPVLRRSLVRDGLLPPPGQASGTVVSRSAQAIRSDGSLVPVAALRAPEAVLSGPAGGVLAVAAVARACGFDRAVGLDMGGTSTDVCRVDVGDVVRALCGDADTDAAGGPPTERASGLPWREGLVEVAGVRVRRRMLEVETIAAGGGSVLANDGLRMRVGPESAGADPGPQCYGRGGPPTLTDAALAVGLMNHDGFDPPLEPSAVSLPGDAAEFIAIGREAMAQAVRRLATARGVALDDHALVAYGGAAGQHAAGVADLLAIQTVIIHPLAAVMSALGQTLARREEERVAGIWAPLGPGSIQTLLSKAQTLTRQVGDALPGATARWVAEIRYASTDHCIDVDFVPAADANVLEALRTGFSQAYRDRFGFDRDLPLEVVHLRVRAVAPRPGLPEVCDEAALELPAGPVVGPKVLHYRHTSIDVPSGWIATHDPRTRGLRLDRQGQGRLGVAAGGPRTMKPTSRTPFGAQLWGNRFQSVADEAGRVLERLAQSVNIRERLDFSVAVFDGGGRLVANAPHIPVHLGAMGATVRDLIARVPNPASGQAYLTNDPAAGGSHLPDLTVVTPVEAGAHRFFVASRGHHADVGGLTPGSMPPHSQRLEDEGFVVRQAPLLTSGRVIPPPHVLAQSRQPDLLVADLGAQIAANAHAARGLLALGSPSLVATWMGHLSDVAAEAVEVYVQTLKAGVYTATDAIDGVRLALTIEVGTTSGSALGASGITFDFGQCGPPHRGNLNCPPAVVRAAVLYALRILVGQPIPMNDGALRHVDIRLPGSSIVAPAPGAAIVGGNVETSQRLVDLVLLAMGHCAAGQGTMNNLTLGGDGWSVYETLGGGAGASATYAGVSGRQVHMTNTRATDPEVFEARLPLRLERFGLRRGSGGDGRHRGGDGLVREVTLLSGGTAALLAPRDALGRAGLDGGKRGLPGVDEVWQNGAWRAWDGSAIELAAGDRVRIWTPGGGGFGDAGES